MRRVIAAGVCSVFLLAACSDDDASSGDSSGSDNQSSDAGSGGGSAGSGSATVTVAGATYEMTEVDNCVVNADGSVNADLGDGSNTVSLMKAASLVSVRVIVDGEEWVDNGSPADPEVSDGTASWSGELIPPGEGGTESATIVITC